GALGVALGVAHRYLGVPRTSAERAGTWEPSAAAPAVTRRAIPRFADAMRGSFLGPSFSDEEIAAWLAQTGYPACRVSRRELPRRIAELLAGGMVVGLLQGRMEFGPRALGARSMIGREQSPRMQ